LWVPVWPLYVCVMGCSTTVNLAQFVCWCKCYVVKDALNTSQDWTRHRGERCGRASKKLRRPAPSSSPPILWRRLRASATGLAFSLTAPSAALATPRHLSLDLFLLHADPSTVCCLTTVSLYHSPIISLCCIFGIWQCCCTVVSDKECPRPTVDGQHVPLPPQELTARFGGFYILTVTG
jgi:hypothetical protein